MTKEELTKGLTYLGMAYDKDYTSKECEMYYDFLKDFSYETFVKAIKNIIKKSKFIPKISELVEECENSKSTLTFDILNFMESQGYFKSAWEFEKASSFLERNIIPEWFKNDMKKYYAMMKQEKLETTERVMIGG